MLRLIVKMFVLSTLLISCEEIINEENISKNEVIAQAPLESSILKTNQEVNYNWQSVAGASDYELQVATPNFDEAAQINLDTLVSSTTFSVDSLKAGEYQWRVRALNSVFSTPYTINAFTVEK